jgi:hypothetical protein
VRFLARARNVSLIQSVKTGSGVHTASYPMDRGDMSPRIKRPGREVDHSPPSIAETNNGGAIYPLSHTSSWRGAQLIKHRNNFIFYHTEVLVKLMHLTA